MTSLRRGEDQSRVESGDVVQVRELGKVSGVMILILILRENESQVVQYNKQ